MNLFHLPNLDTCGCFSCASCTLAALPTGGSKALDQRKSAFPDLLLLFIHLGIMYNKVHFPLNL